MSDTEGALPPPPSPVASGSSRSTRRTRVVWVVLGLIAVGSVTVGLLIVRGVLEWMKEPPSFPTLAAEPDPTLKGTVAYLDGTSRCVRVAPIAGGAPRDVYCFAPDAGYDLDWTSLVWLPDGRLEITTHNWPPEQPIRVDSQRIVDVASGRVEDVPADRLPAPRVPDRNTGPTVSSTGAELRVENHGSDASLVLVSNGASRTLLEASGNPEYEFADPMWGPDETWVLVDDGRLLLVTVDGTPRTRILLEGGTRGLSAGARGWAVTGRDFATGS